MRFQLHTPERLRRVCHRRLPWALPCICSDHERLWVKDYGKAWCLDLRHERYLKQPEQVFSETGIREKVNDLFVDSEKGLWLVSSKGIWETRKKRYLLLPKDAGELQDVEVSDGRIYLFSSSGEVLCYSQNQGKLLYRATAYPESEHANYGRTSLVVKDLTATSTKSGAA